MNVLASYVVLGLSAIVSCQAGAATIAGTTFGVSTLRVCTVIGISGCDSVGTGPAYQTAYGGLPGDSIASSSAADPAFGIASTNATFSGPAAEPHLWASAASLAGMRTNGNAGALQRYTLTGASPELMTLNAIISYSQAITGQYPQTGVGAGVHAGLEIFQITGNSITVDGTALANGALGLSWYSMSPGYTPLNFGQYRDTETRLNGVGQFSAQVLMQPGASYWVRALLQTSAPNGSAIDAWATVTTQWDNSPSLVPGVAAAVPEPGTAGSLGMGLLALAVARARRGSRRQ